MKNFIPTLLTSVALLASSSYAMACNETKPIEVRFAKDGGFISKPINRINSP